MRKHIGIALILILICYFAIIPQNDYKIISTYKNSFDNYQGVSISVIVKPLFFDEAEMFRIISNDYCEFNGKPNELRITLYDNQIMFNKAISRHSHTFHFE